ncbi:MAG: N-formylglutamate amidohydrolase [Actinomycetota bacterium]|nr:N-formylglutamate amidohydrolase [Actinomycetota bacterium]
MRDARTWDVTVGEGPVAAVAIHNGHDIRPDLEDLVALDDERRRREEDPFTERLAAVVPTRIVVHRSRFEVDLNRDRDDAVCVVPEECWDLHVWASPPDDRVLEEARRIYDRFYAQLEQLLRGIVARYERFAVLDVHSYNHRRGGPNAPPADPAQNPEVNVGTGSMPRDRWAHLVERFVDDLAGCGLDVRENVKFRGRRLAAFVHETFPDSGCCLAIEFKKMFMDELTGELFEPELRRLERCLAGTLPGLRESLR